MKREFTNRQISKMMKQVSCSKISKFLQEDGEYDLMLEGNDRFILKNLYYYKKGFLNTAIKIGGYTENGIKYRLENLIIKHNYDEFVRFLEEVGEIEKKSQSDIINV